MVVKCKGGATMAEKEAPEVSGEIHEYQAEVVFFPYLSVEFDCYSFLSQSFFFWVLDCAFSSICYN